MERAALPSQLAAPEPTWERDVDVVVVGSGAAGLAVALAVRPVRSALIVTKGVLAAGSTSWAQGGLAAVLDPTDSLENHVRDTLAAGAGLCDEAVVRELVAEAPTAIRYLMRLGAAFDPASHGGDEPALTREGGHSHNRIVHSGGDRSGLEVQRTLDESAVAAGVEVLEHAFVLDVVVGHSAGGQRQARGVRVALLDVSGAVTSVGVVWARATVLATGGYGQAFASTSNPPAVTGDGVAIAMRAGLDVRDVEFVQFHPTVMWIPPEASEVPAPRRDGAGRLGGRLESGQQALVSEAVRGEGAILFDGAGERVMKGVHPQEDLAPRDVVAAAISERMAEAPGGIDDHVFLDATSMGERFYTRFPSITEACKAIGVDPARERIPVAPAAHYACGGIPAKLDGATALPGLYAVGEVSCTGVHGANRLASNSLTESVVAGTRLGRDLAWELPEPTTGAEAEAPGPAGLVDPARRVAIRSALSRHAGVVRDAGGLAAAAAALDEIAASIVPGAVAPTRAAFETTNVLTVARAVLAAASARTESRGCHRRSDHPDRRPEWLTHLAVSLTTGDGDAPVAVAGGPSAAARV